MYKLIKSKETHKTIRETSGKYLLLFFIIEGSMNNECIKSKKDKGIERGIMHVRQPVRWGGWVVTHFLIQALL